MFLTGVLVGTVLGATACLAVAAVRLLADEAELGAPLPPVLVPLHAPGVTLVSMN